MNVVLVTDKAGNKVALNPAHIISFQRFGANSEATTVQMTSSGGDAPTHIYVQETLEEIVELLRK